MPTTGVVQPCLFQEELAALLSRLKMDGQCSLGLNALCLEALKDLTQPEQTGLGLCDVLQVGRSRLCPTRSPPSVRWLWAAAVQVLTAECCKRGAPAQQQLCQQSPRAGWLLWHLLLQVFSTA